MAGRPTTYTEELGKRICHEIAGSDQGLRKLLAEHDDFPTLQTVLQWTRNNAQFADHFAQAKRQQIEAMAEDIVDLSNDDSIDPNDKRIRIDTRKWLLSKLIPRTYGDKLDVTSDGQALQVPTHQIDARVQSIIMMAQARRNGAMQEAIEGLDTNALKLLE
jgi:hypothetical protein